MLALFIYLCIYLFCFLGPQPQHMEVPRPGVQQCRIWATSVTYAIAHTIARSLNHLARPGIEPKASWLLVGFVSAAPWWELQNLALNCFPKATFFLIKLSVSFQASCGYIGSIPLPSPVDPPPPLTGWIPNSQVVSHSRHQVDIRVTATSSTSDWSFDMVSHPIRNSYVVIRSWWCFSLWEKSHITKSNLEGHQATHFQIPGVWEVSPWTSWETECKLADAKSRFVQANCPFRCAYPAARRSPSYMSCFVPQVKWKTDESSDLKCACFYFPFLRLKFTCEIVECNG